MEDDIQTPYNGFGPVDGEIQMPDNVKVTQIMSASQIPLLNELVGQPYIGVDSEWRVKVHQWHNTSGTCILQLSTIKHCFIIDLKCLKDNKDLNKLLTTIFTHKSTTILGFGFTADLSQLEKSCGKMTFFELIPKFLDI